MTGRGRRRLRRATRTRAGLQPLNSAAGYSDKPRAECPYQDFYPDFDVFRQLVVVRETRAANGVVEHENESVSGRIDHVDETYPDQPADQSSIKPPFRSRPAVDYPSTRYDKALSSVGYHASNAEFSLPSSYVRVASGPHEVRDDQDAQQFIVEYDMDEQDEKYLENLNSRRTTKQKANPISKEIFECLMTLYELEWYNIESKMPPKKKIAVTDEISDSTDDQKCLICDESECDNSNAIVFCDGCDIAVHQECYGVPFIPEGQWLCRQCAISRRRKASCIFCPNKSGALKQTDTQHWAHVLCALWIPEAWISNHVYMEPICGLERVPKGRWKLNCYICKQRVGACIQCVNKGCFQAFHPTCARKARLCMRMLGGIPGALNDPGTLVSYCNKHTPDDYTEDVATHVASAQRHYDELRRSGRALSALGPDTPNIIRESRIIRRASKAAKPWRTEQGTPVLPLVAANKIIDQFSQLFNKIDWIPELVYELSKYWTLKRQWRRGAALTKRLQLALEMQPSYPTSIDETCQKLQFYEGLLGNLNAVRKVLRLVRDREDTKLELAKCQLAIVDLVNFPVQHLIQEAWEKIRRVDVAVDILGGPSSSSTFEPQLDTKVKNRQYRTVEEFKDDLYGYLERIKLEYTRDTGEYRAATRIEKSSISAISKAHIREKSILRNPQNNDIADFRNFGPQGLSVSEEIWSGVRLLREMTPLSDIDEDELYELEHGRRKRLRGE